MTKGRGESDLVVLVDESGSKIGQAAKADVHTTSTPLHAAFSCYLTNTDRQVLLTRRALKKVAWPGVWTGTCCGHPHPDEATSDAVLRRARTELGIALADVHLALPSFRYRAVDPDGIVENEFCPVFLAEVEGTPSPQPDPDEVVEWRWTPISVFVSTIRMAPFLFTPWALDQVELLIEGGHWSD